MSRKRACVDDTGSGYVAQFCGLVVLHPLVDLGLGHTNDILGGIQGIFTAAHIQEVQTGRSLIQGLLITGGIAVEATDVLLDQSSGLGIVFLLANDLFHGGTSFRGSFRNGAIIHPNLIYCKGNGV